MSETPQKPIVSVVVDDEQRDAIDQIAQQFKVTRSVVLRWAIDEYIARFFLTNRPVEKTDISPVRQPAEAAA